MRFRLFLCLLALATVALAKPRAGALRSVDVIAAADANQASATALDLVFVYSQEAGALLPKSGPEWFEKKSALLSGLAAQIDAVSLQVPPGTALPAVTLPAQQRRAVIVLAYLNYLAPEGQPVLTLTSFRHAVIRLHATSVDVAEQPAGPGHDS
ncbi:hypothetical protein [Oleiharenicola sp. Vm1]|uniref:hypothetical protein n=1 Tax=Oleiharenicola sp. Vm1 TaxID=3398393 RepID=UPI0039F485A0